MGAPGLGKFTLLLDFLGKSLLRNWLKEQSSLVEARQAGNKEKQESGGVRVYLFNYKRDVNS